MQDDDSTVFHPTLKRELSNSDTAALLLAKQKNLLGRGQHRL